MPSCDIELFAVQGIPLYRILQASVALGHGCEDSRPSGKAWGRVRFTDT